MKGTRGTERSGLSAKVAQYLVDHINEKQLKSGDKLPSEIRIGSELKVSRGVVREAYHSLQTAGIIEISNGRSPSVGKLKNEAFTQLLCHALSTEQVSPYQVLELRCAVEVHAAELAASNRTEGHVKGLQKEVEGMRQTLLDHGRFVRHDVRFHEIIGKATSNRLFEIISESLRGALEDSVRAGLRSRTTEVQMARVVDTHEAIAEAIGNRQVSTVGHLMAVHFDEAKNALRNALKTARTAS